MIKKYNEFLTEELKDFFNDFEISKKKLKLFTTFSKFKGEPIEKNLKINKPKKKFQPKVKGFKKTNNDKNIF